MIMFSSNEVRDWLDTFDGNDTEVLLTSIANNKIKHEIMVDSIHSFVNGETKLAERLYKDMWKK